MEECEIQKNPEESRYESGYEHGYRDAIFAIANLLGRRCFLCKHFQNDMTEGPCSTCQNIRILNGEDHWEFNEELLKPEEQEG